MTALATLGGGCFWCLEAVYLELRGVLGVKSGYAGGHVASPTYEQVCGKKTGHAEVVQVAFDPAEVTYRELLEVFLGEGQLRFFDIDICDDLLPERSQDREIYRP